MGVSVTVYGIANCDKLRAARKWLDQSGIAAEFHDYRKQGLDRELLSRMEQSLGWENLLNRRGTSWRALDYADKTGVDRDKAMALMLANPALIKRPVLAVDDQWHLGFTDAQYREIFA